ncbi:MAG: UDP-2,3-diacylglucosamine diphosphatase [Longimonas sp.]|uniref:UDP-2,3-diacylglucosamine diphosphatase n=1 Tax=Longimonas sp. TaxID=2039626 RepID=UPI00335D076F
MDASPRYRTVWISDVHLGTRDAKAASVVDFLQRHSAERYYLVGDIVDGWSLARSWYWPEAHNRVVETLLKCARNADVIYIPGNHDEAARRFPGLRFGGITTQMNHIHTTADGRRFLVLHGDEFDGMIRHAPWLSHGGAIAYQALLTTNRYVNRVRRWMNLPYWSFSQYVKQRTKKAVQFIANFETVVARRAAKENVDGVICGHIHHPVIRKIDSVQYVNTGDWIESCTGVVEHMDGTLELRRWLPGRTDVRWDALPGETAVGPTDSDATHEGDALPGAAMAEPHEATWSPSSE